MSIAVALAALLAPTQGEPEVDLARLLARISDRRAMCELPDPAFTAHLASSRGGSGIAGGPGQGEAAGFVRVDERAGRRECVLADVEGPGAIVRIATPNPRGRLAVYVDGADAASIDEPLRALLAGELAIPTPLAGERSGGFASYLPIPFAARCVVACSDCDGLEYEVEHRRYAAGTRVESLRPGDLARGRIAVGVACEALRKPSIDPRSERRPFEILLSGSGGESAVRSCSIDVAAGPTGALCVTEIALELDSEPTERPARIERALQQTAIAIAFDGVETVRAPLGDFFGAPVALDAYSTAPLEVRRSGRMIARFPMPFRERATLRLESYSGERVLVRGSIATAPYDWTERSLYFFAAWRREEPLAADPPRAWRALAVEGRGVLAGESLCVGNLAAGWWGSGRVALAVDGDAALPLRGADAAAHFGFAPRSSSRFDSPFGARARCEGPLDFGWSVQTRVRALDVVPFASRLALDFELAHETPGAEVSCTATTYFYATLDARVDRAALAPYVERGMTALAGRRCSVPGAIEAEACEVVRASEGVAVDVEAIAPGAAPRCSGDRRFLARAERPGVFVELAIPIAEPARREVLVLATRGRDHGVLRFSLDGAACSGELDLFAPADESRASAGGLHPLGVFDLAPPRAVLRVEIAGANPAARPPGYAFGLDCIVLREPAR
jgi:hypothetical protein